MALSTGFCIDIYPVERVIHVSHYWALYFSQYRYAVSPHGYLTRAINFFSGLIN